MNTDKLMELERKWRAGAFADMEKYGPFRDSPGETGELAQTIYAQAQTRMADADELAAAIRAEQAVGDEQRARELFADELEKAGMEKTAKHCRAGNLIAGHQPALRAIRRALGATRQSEGVVLDRNAVEALVAGPFMYHHKMNELQRRYAEGFDRCREMTLKNIEIYFATRAAMLAAAPGGEGEG